MLEERDRELLKTLRAQLLASGAFERDDGFYWRHLLLLTTLLGLSFAGTFLATDLALRVACAFAWGCIVLQFGFMGHDAGHHAINRSRRINDFWGRFTMTFVVGIGFDYWQRRHNTHHKTCQIEGEDPDMQFNVVLSVHEQAARQKRGFARAINRWQAWYFLPMLLLYTFSLRIDGFINTMKRGHSARDDGWLLVLHYLVWLCLPAWFVGWPQASAFYVASSSLTGLLVGVSFSMNHVGRKTIPAGQRVGFLVQQIESSRGFSLPGFADPYAGGLNFHIEHHLFPSVVLPRLRVASSVVQRFCREQGIEYHAPPVGRALSEVLAHLARVARLMARPPGPPSGAVISDER
jgi:fatty acid desaturase